MGAGENAFLRWAAFFHSVGMGLSSAKAEELCSIEEIATKIFAPLCRESLLFGS